MASAIFIGGGTGSGKSTLSRALYTYLGGRDRCVRLEADFYYNPRHRRHPERRLTAEQLARYNFDHPRAIDFALMADHIRRLKAGESVRVPRYDFASHRRKDRWVTVKPRPIVIVEGILVLADKAMRAQADFRVFVETPDDIRLYRRMRRDIKERGRTEQSVLEQWEKTVHPMHLIHCAPSSRHAHLIVHDGGRSEMVRQVLGHQFMQGMCLAA